MTVTNQIPPKKTQDYLGHFVHGTIHKRSLSLRICIISTQILRQKRNAEHNVNRKPKSETKDQIDNRLNPARHHSQHAFRPTPVNSQQGIRLNNSSLITCHNSPNGTLSSFPRAPFLEISTSNPVTIICFSRWEGWGWGVGLLVPLSERWTWFVPSTLQKLLTDPFWLSSISEFPARPTSE